MKSTEQRSPPFVAACLTLVLVLNSAGAAGPAAPQPCSAPAQDGSKPATEATQRHNAAFGARLKFADRQDFEDAKRGLLARPDQLTIKDATGSVVWDLEAYKAFIAEDKPAPDSVNPSLWRNAQLELQYGLFEVVDGVYQVRGYDISNITFVRGSTGWIVGDPLSSVELTQAAYELVSAHLGQRPVVAVVYSHAHVDHYAGVRALVSDADVQSSKVTIIAPDRFTEHAASENALAGNAASRRAAFRLGSLLPKSPTGSVTGGLAPPPSPRASGLLFPNDSIERSGETRSIDGVEMVFQLTSGAEAPAEMNVFFPQLRALWLAENTTHAQRDRLAPRGAEARDGLSWARFLDEAIEAYGPNIDAQFASHHWPLWGNARILEFLEKQRDLSRYIHDQAVRLLNQGYLGGEIAELIQLPPELDLPWYDRDYYGGVKPAARAVYQRYLGDRDPSPSALDPLPPAAAARKYVEYMGGASAVLARARADFDRGEYRWVAEALRHVLFADPNDQAARGLLADAYEQLGYQSESVAWRAEYLQGARELRQSPPATPAPVSRDSVSALPLEQLFASWGVRLDAQKAAGKRLALVFAFPDLAQQWALTLQNSVLTASRQIPTYPDATVTLTRAALDAVSLGEQTVEQSLTSGHWAVTGRTDAVTELLAMLDTSPSGFDIAAPRANDPDPSFRLPERPDAGPPVEEERETVSR